MYFPEKISLCTAVRCECTLEQLAPWKMTRKNPSPPLLKWFCSRRLKRGKSEESGKENKPKAAAKARHVSAEELPRRRTSLAECRRSEMLKTSRWNLQMRGGGGGSSSEMLPKEIKQQQRSAAISLDWLPYTTTTSYWDRLKCVSAIRLVIIPRQSNGDHHTDKMTQSDAKL